jgi:hypothetical protein
MPNEIHIIEGGGCMEPKMAYWHERLYKSSDKYDADSQWFENALKSQHLEGKMGAREIAYSKGGGLPTLVPLSGAAGPQPPG